MSQRRSDITVFGTCPPPAAAHGPDYLEQVREVAQWSDRAGYEGILIFTDNRSVDPWLVAQTVLQTTSRLTPLVALQPVYMHPFTAAKLVADLAYLYGRRVHLNVVAGGFSGDLTALGDAVEHDARYDRAVEYALIMQRLLTSPEPVTFEGAYYSVAGLRLKTLPGPELVPDFLFSGSSKAGLEAARAVSATAVVYPQEPGQQAAADPSVAQGLRIGVIARPSSAEAWEAAVDRFPEDRAGQVTHRLAMARSDSQWHRQLSESIDRHEVYWMRPFKNYKTFCPYLVGDYATVGREIARYFDLGYRTLILDTPAQEQDLMHTAAVLDIARSRSGECV
jgi:alkanesulfonate monooxygenase